MKATAVLILALFLVGPAVAAPPKGADELGQEIAALTDAIKAQLKLLKLYEDMGKTADGVATRRTLIELLVKQREAGEELMWILGGKPKAEPSDEIPDGLSDEPFAGPRTREPDSPAVEPQNTRQVIDRGLAWLARQQDEAGYWDSDSWMKPHGLGPEAGAGQVYFDPGVTGLALLAFFGDGHTHKSGRHKKTVMNGMRYLKQIQDPEGCFGPRTSQRFVYNHALAAIAMIEAYALTGSPLFKQSSQLATDFIHKAQNPYLAWRYGVRSQDNDTSVTSWMAMALFSAKRAGLRVSDPAFEGAMNWIEKMTDPEFGRIGYFQRGGAVARPEGLMDRFPAVRSEAMTAAGLVTRVHCGKGKGEAYQKGLALCLKRLPTWNPDGGDTDMYYWFWGTKALRQAGGGAWKAWRKALVPVLLTAQNREGILAGSFDPVGPWGPNGGRIYSTAIMTLAAEMAESAALVKKPVVKPGK